MRLEPRPYLLHRLRVVLTGAGVGLDGALGELAGASLLVGGAKGKRSREHEGAVGLLLGQGIVALATGPSLLGESEGFAWVVAFEEDAG